MAELNGTEELEVLQEVLEKTKFQKVEKVCFQSRCLAVTVFINRPQPLSLDNP